MQEFLSTVLYPALFAFLGIAGTKVWDWIKPKVQKDIDNADAQAKKIENEIKSAAFYRSLLDDADIRINKAIAQLEERDKRIEERDIIIKGRDERIDKLIDEIEILTNEMKKYKQLNGKVECALEKT
ncbi:hypothetical protein [Flavobacterium sp.]